jgi:hypothetical protein
LIGSCTYNLFTAKDVLARDIKNLGAREEEIERVNILIFLLLFFLTLLLLVLLVLFLLLLHLLLHVLLLLLLLLPLSLLYELGVLPC